MPHPHCTVVTSLRLPRCCQTWLPRTQHDQLRVELDRRLEALQDQFAARQATWKGRIDELRNELQRREATAELAASDARIEQEQAAASEIQARLEQAEQNLRSEQGNHDKESARLAEVNQIRAELDAAQSKIETECREADQKKAELRARQQKIKKLEKEQMEARKRTKAAEARVRDVQVQRAQEWQQCSASGERWEPHKYALELQRAHDAGQPTVTVGAGTPDERVVHFVGEYEVKNGERLPVRNCSDVPPAWLWLEEHCPQPFACPYVYSSLGSAGLDDPRSENMPETSLEYKTQSETFIKNFKW